MRDHHLAAGTTDDVAAEQKSHVYPVLPAGGAHRRTARNITPPEPFGAGERAIASEEIASEEWSEDGAATAVGIA